LVKLGSLAGVKVCSSTISITAGHYGMITDWNGASKLFARASAFSEFEGAIQPGVTRGGEGVGNLINRLVRFHRQGSSGSRLTSVPLH
jgi:hypothetical protein